MTWMRRAAWCRSALPCLFLGVAAPAPAQEAAPPEAEQDADSCVGKARLRGLGFERNGTLLDGGDSVILDVVAEVIRDQCAGRTIVIEGHTDVWGDPEYNRRLSERRAEAVKDYLVERGIPAEQLRVEGLGEDHPLTTDPARSAQALNRRITLRSEPSGS